MQRRSFLKGFAALAACAVIPKTLDLLPKDDRERLVTAMKTGYIEGQNFFFTGPIVIAFDNLVFKNCSFIFDCPYKMDAAVTIEGKKITIDRCFFDAGKNKSEVGILVRGHQPEGCYIANNRITS